MKIVITESQKKKLFIPRKLDKENSRYDELNKEQPIKGGKRINQYDHEGKKQGYWEEYYDNGNIDYKGSYKDGIKDGYWEYYYCWYNGNIIKKGSYKNGLEEGMWEGYNNKGNIDYKGSYKDGKRDGVWEFYWGNGNIYSKGSYINGKENGIWENYHYNGNIMYKELYKNGRVVKTPPLTESEEPKKTKLFIPRKLDKENSRYAELNKSQPIKDGKRINQYDYEGKKQGYWEEYWSDGKIMSKGLYKDGKREGIWEKYWDNGNMSEKGLYKDGGREGIWEYFHYKGNLHSKIIFKNSIFIKEIPLTESKEPKKNKLFIPRKLDKENSRYNDWNNSQPMKDGNRINQYNIDGKKQGYWEEYYDNGNIWSKGDYKDEKRVGYWEMYWISGDLRFKCSYKDGILNGYYESYFTNGNLEEKGEYVNGNREGVWEFYWSDGDVLSKSLYKNGFLIKRLPLNESEEPKKGKLFIPRKLDKENSRYEELNKEQPMKDGKRINQYDYEGKKQGYWEDYYSNGNLTYRGSYKNGKSEGMWEWYWLNGNLWYKGSYKDGKEEGIWEWYYYNGNLNSKGEYKDGKKEGVWKFFDRFGKLTDIKEFIGGRVISK